MTVGGLESDQRGVAVGRNSEFAGDGGHAAHAGRGTLLGGCALAEAQQLLHPPRVGRRPCRQSRHDPGGQHRGAPQHLLGVFGQGM